MAVSKQAQTKLRSEIANMPVWLRRSIGRADEISAVQRIVKQRGIHTICEEGRCPNRGECYASQTATFLLMGPTCTRSCAFCQVDKGHAPMPLDIEEPEKIADAVKTLGLRYVVITSVARDDLPDKGASHFVKTIEAIRQLNPLTKIEVLTSDFWGGADIDEASQRQRIKNILEAKPTCYNHNIETVRRLTPSVRRGAKYDRSLWVLQIVKEISPYTPTKSGLMLGHGEILEEVIETMTDLRRVNCNYLTIGQYMRPSLGHLPVQKYWTPEEFVQLGAIAEKMGFSQVNSGPLVRSSYHAGKK